MRVVQINTESASKTNSKQGSTDVQNVTQSECDTVSERQTEKQARNRHSE